MNSFEELANRRLKRIDEIKKMSRADLDQLLSTMRPMVTAADIDSPLAEAVRQNGPVGDLSKNLIDPEELEDAYFDKSWNYDQLPKEGLFNVQGQAPRRYVREYVHELVMVKNKLVVVVGGTEDDLFDAVGDRRWVRPSESVDSIPHGVIRIITTINDEPSGEAYDLTEQEYAIALRDEIATQPIEAVVLIDQEGKLKFLDEITKVAVYRGNKISHFKKIPIFHIHTENWEWVEKCRNGQPGMRLKKEVFERVRATDTPVVAAIERVGCVEKASDMRKEHREWLWKGYIGRNRVAHYGGASTEGKSPVTLDIIARVTSGSDWPDSTKNELGPRSAILLAAEDDWSDTIIPRLEVAGADLNKVHRFFVKQQTVELTPSLDNDCQRLEQEIERIGDVALVVIDPITNYLGSKKMNMEEEIRGGILMPLSQLAKNKHCAVITVGHLNKRGSEVTVLQRLMGAAAFSGVARDVFIFGPDPEDEDKYAHVMSEIRNKSAPKLKYRTQVVNAEWDGKTSEIIRVKWCGVSHADVDDVVNAPKSQEKSMTTRAVAIISGMLRSGAKRKAELDQALKENGIDPEKLQFDRIRKRCKAESRPLPGKGAGWEWFIPTPKQEEFDK